MHSINLGKYELRTDMAIDLIEKNESKIEQKISEENGIKTTYIKLEKDNDLGKKEGTYITIEFGDVTDTDIKEDVSKALARELKNILKTINYNMGMKTLVIGLGNIKSTPDALGPMVSNNIIVTKHLFDMDVDVDKNFSCVSTIYPGVTGSTGIETLSIIKGVVCETKPDLVIIVDALASTSLERINRSIQLSDSGIMPGSGVGNKRMEISKDTLDVPVIAIGVPTVVDAAVIVFDTINYMFKNYAYNKKLEQSKSAKLIIKSVNYLKKNVKVEEDDKRKLLGLIGDLSSDELLRLTYEVLDPTGYNFMVTPKEVDFVMEKLSDIVSYAINHTLHNI